MTRKSKPEQSDATEHHHRQLRHLPLSVMLEETGSSKLILNAILSICLIVVLFIIWSAFTQIDEVARASGEILPSENIRTIQHLEGGIVERILVKNDQIITAGQVIVELSSAAAESELERMRSRALNLRVDLARLRAFIYDKAFDHDDLKKRLSGLHEGMNKSIIEKMIMDAEKLHEFQQQSRLDDSKILKIQITQREEELLKLNEKKANLDKQIQLLQEEESIYKRLENENSVSRVTIIAVSRQLNQAYGDRAATMSDLIRTKQILEEAKQRLVASDASIKKEALEEISEKDSELLDVVTAIQRTEDRVRRLLIRSPSAGIVKGLELTLGSVVAPGATVCEVVPLDDEMIAEAKLATKDIGHIKVGDAANVKVTTYDFVRYGQVSGKIISISASTFLTEQGSPYYKVKIQLDKPYVGNNPESNRLLPGMITTVDIITGRKSVLNYLLKPIYRSFEEGFRER